MKKPKPNDLRLICSNVRLLSVEHGRSKGTSVIQFTLTIIFGQDEASCTWRNCLAGVRKDGPWAMPPQDKWKKCAWNKAFSDRIIAGFQKAKYFDKLGIRTWAEEQEVSLEF